MKIISQSCNSVGEYRKAYIIDVTDKYNKKWSRIDGELINSRDTAILGKYRDHEQAQDVLKLLMLEPDVFTMPQEEFLEDDNFIYPIVD